MDRISSTFPAAERIVELNRLPPFIATLLLIVSSPVHGAAQRTLSWPEISVRAHIDADGRMAVQEMQSILFSGDWNGGERGFDVRTGQRLRLEGMDRLDPETSSRIEMERGDLERVHQFDMLEGNRVRWRAREVSDPPFDNDLRSWILRYSLWPVLEPEDDRSYQFSHDFLFSDRTGEVSSFRLVLTWDPVWEAPVDSIVEVATALAPGRGYAVRQTFRYVAAGTPSDVPHPAPTWVRVLAGLVALSTLPLTLFRLRQRSGEMDAVAAPISLDQIDAPWLEHNLLTLKPEVAGAAWDRSVGSAEVAALLARLVAEGKLSSRVDESGKDPVLHLKREADWEAFAKHERSLLEGLFFDGGRETDTESIREQYKSSGFKPAERIRENVLQSVDRLPGAGRIKRRWGRPLLLMLAGALLATIGARGTGGWQIGAFAAVGIAVITAFSAGFAAALSKRVVQRTGPAMGLIIAQAIGAAWLLLIAAGMIDGAMPYLTAGTSLLVGLSIMLGASSWLAYRVSAPTDTPERLAFRRKLAAAREYFEEQLKAAEPQLDDAWFPWMLGFGLGGHVDRWFREFSAAGNDRPGAVFVPTSGGASGGRSSGGWTGGGPQFGGGGGFGGGGAGGAWGLAASGMASGVAPPNSSSSGGGGGGSSSGGGSGGGW